MAYDVGETLEATLIWSEPVTISTPSGGLLPKVWVVYGSGASGHTDIAEYASGSGTARTVFRHTLTSGSYSLVGVSHNSLRVRDGSIVSLESGLDAELGHSSYYSAQSENQAEAVTIIGVPTFNGPGPDNAWSAGEAVEVTFIFSRPVQVDTTGGAPSLSVLLSGTASRQALYLRGSGTRQLVFGYTLTGADGTHSSLLVAPDSLALNGGSIQDVNNMLDAGDQGPAAGPEEQRRLGDPRTAGRQRTGNHRAPGHYGLHGGGRHLHRGPQAALQPPEITVPAPGG